MPLALPTKCLAENVAAQAISLADSDLPPFLQQTLSTARDKYHVPALAALIQIDGELVGEAAVGVRAMGHPEPVTIHDRWYIASDTKAFTAMLIARLVEQHVMSFDDTPATTFPAFADKIGPAYRTVTITQLLSHTAGLPSNLPFPAMVAIVSSGDDVKAQRDAIVRQALAMPPASKPGEFSYSNLGFLIAGAMAEARTGKTWEDLIREQIFRPLGISNAGFGAPGTSRRFDQPRGHRENNGKLEPVDPGSVVDAQAPLAIGPAATINIELNDWVRFAQDQLDGELGKGRLLTPGSYRKLHTPLTSNYALGWEVVPGAHGAPAAIHHQGSNGVWLSEIWIFPKSAAIFLVASNAGNSAAERAVEDVIGALSHKTNAMPAFARDSTASNLDRKPQSRRSPTTGTGRRRTNVSAAPCARAQEINA